MMKSNSDSTGMKVKASVSPSISLLTYRSKKSTEPRSLAWQIAPNLLLSFQYAWAGVRYAFTTQRNFRIHSVVAAIAVSLSIFLQITPVEMAVITLHQRFSDGFRVAQYSD